MSDTYSGWVVRPETTAAYNPYEELIPTLANSQGGGVSGNGGSSGPATQTAAGAALQDAGSGAGESTPGDMGPNPGTVSADTVGALGGLFGGAVGMATGIGGLGLAGRGIASGLAGLAADKDLTGMGLPGLGFQGIASGIAHGLTGGLIGTSIDSHMSPQALGMTVAGMVPGIDVAVDDATSTSSVGGGYGSDADNSSTSAGGFGPDGDGSGGMGAGHGMGGGPGGEGFGDGGMGDSGGFGDGGVGDAGGYGGDAGGYGGDNDGGDGFADGGRVGWLNDLPENPTEDDLPPFEARVGGRRPQLADRQDVKDRISRQASAVVREGARMLLPQTPEQAALMAIATPAIGIPARAATAAGLGLMGFSRGAGRSEKPGYAQGGLMGYEPPATAEAEAYLQSDPSVKGSAQALQMWQMARAMS